MVRAKTESGWKHWSFIEKDPYFFCAPRHRIRRERAPRPQKVYPEFPPIVDHVHRSLRYRLSVLDDVEMVIKFVDRLLAGKDFFCPRGQHIGYYKYKTIVVALDFDTLVGWAVRQRNGSLIHLLVDTDYRGKGIGTHLLKVLEPLFVRSKFDQSTGDPLKFYEDRGYEKTTDERIGRNKNIDLLTRK